MASQSSPRIVAVTFALTLGVHSSSLGTSIFFEDAEAGNLNQWTGQYGGSHQGTIVSDPLRVGNHVITFTGLNLGGDIFTSSAFSLVSGQQYRVSFEYLGLPTANSVAHDTGGFFGLSEDYPGNHMWYYGTSTLFSSPTYTDTLIDDGTWHRYAFDFTPPLFGLNNSLHLMFEDWVDASGVAGDAFFDNIRLESVSSAVPETGTWGMIAIGSIAMACYLRRPSRSSTTH